VSFPPAGVALGAYGLVDVSPLEGPPVILADHIDPETGDWDDLMISHTVFDGMLIEAYAVERNSGPAVEFVGHTLREVRDTDPSAVGEFKSRAQLPVDELERTGMCKLLSAKPVVDGDTVELEIVVQDLTMASDGPSTKQIPLQHTATTPAT